MCGKTFDKKYYLLEHMNAIHLNRREYICTICGEFSFWFWSKKPQGILKYFYLKICVKISVQKILIKFLNLKFILINAKFAQFMLKKNFLNFRINICQKTIVT